MSEKKVRPVPALSEKATEVLEFLKANADKQFTLAELKEQIADVNSAHLTALRTRGLIDSEEVEMTVLKPTKSKVLRYIAKGE